MRSLGGRPARPARALRPRWSEALRRFLACLSLVMLAAAPAPAAPEGARHNADYFSNLPVTTHEGKTVPFYDALIKGKKVVFSFVYLNCNDICPLTTSRIAEIRDRLGDAVGRDIFIYSMTMDPERDTPEMLKMHADAFGADKGWLFLTGKPEDIKLLRWRLGERSRTLSEHRNDMILGNDVTGEWSRASIYSDLDVAVSTIRSLDPAWRAKRKSVAGAMDHSADKYRVDQHVGQALFLKACATCHSIGGGDLVGPDLKDIAIRRDTAWLQRFLMAPEKMRAEGDPVALANSVKYRGVKMPNLGLREADVADLLVYIEGRSRAKDAQTNAGKAAGTQPGG